MDDKKDLSRTYSVRFDESEWKKRDSMWRIICNEFFDKYVSTDDDVLDVAAGYCDFINNIAVKSKKGDAKIGRRIAVDLNPDVKLHAGPNVEAYNAKAQELDFIEDNSIDVVFMSNFLEHIRVKTDILTILKECRRVLKKNGRLMILQPNIRFVGGKYWDFFDHYTPLTEKSLEEALEIVGGYRITKTVLKFLPYTTKSSIPQKDWMIRLYCKMPLAWKIMGKQTFMIAVKE